jgi:hypothetical protein
MWTCDVTRLADIISAASLLVSNQWRRAPCHPLWKLWDENTNQE